MAPETLELIQSLIPVCSAIAGAIVGVAGTVIVTYMNKKSEERKHLASLSFNAGTENFKASVEITKARILNYQKSPNVLPLEYYILNMKYLTDIIQKKGLRKEELKAFILQKNEIMEGVFNAAYKPNLEKDTEKVEK
ncbi:MAG: hypothetical protein KKF12_21930 [Proteobacteria bacterium]|nr:hypothetical protein [Desulfobacula sp.]MBU4133488.1 hypothetical protein [Pseudomonadota bacterium]